jgi:hypothetical protein
MSKNLLYLPGVQEAPKAVRSKMDTILVTPQLLSEWQTPVCQRPLKVNSKVRAIAEELKNNGGVINGVLTLGTIGGKPRPVYLLDGQHRCEAVKISELDEAIADVRIVDYDNLTDMGDDWVKLNSPIVRLTPDDTLHALENSIPALSYIRTSCPFVGYSNVRRNETSALVSMSVVIRCWHTAQSENLPTATHEAGQLLARDLVKFEYERLVVFLQMCRVAWGNDHEYARLWGTLNLTLCMWLYRRLVVPAVKGQKRHIIMTPEQFKKCLMSLSASSTYLDWLMGRKLSDRDRTPAFARIKRLFADRIEADTQQKVKLPQPAWSS